jgi:hypothetical protein
MKALLTGGLLMLGACGGAPFSVEGSDPSVAAPVAVPTASSAPTPMMTAAPATSASAAPTAPAPTIGTSLVVPDAGATSSDGTPVSHPDAGAPDVDTCDQSRANTHQNGFGGGWEDCIPAATYSPADVGLAEAIKACNSSPFSNGNTCRGDLSGSCVPYATNIPQLSPTGNQSQYYWTVGSPPLADGVDRALANDNVFVAVPGTGPESCVFASPVSTWN